MSFSKRYAQKELGVLVHKGAWDASTNTPTLTSSVGGRGDYYIVSVAGTTNLDGITDWQIGDWVMFSGSVWQKIDNSETVTSVAGKTGDVSLVKADVGLANVPNVDATVRANHTGTQTSSTISDFSSSVDSRISLQKGTSLGLATLDSGGKVPSSQLPSTIMEYRGTWNPSTNSPTLQNGSLNNSLEDIGNIYVASTSGSVNFGAGAITFAAGDWVILNSSFVWEKSINSNAVVSVNGYQGVVSLIKSDVGLGNVDNTSDLNKPISTATQTALNLKYDASNPSGYVNTTQAAAAAPVQSVAGRTGAVTLTKTDVGLSNVPNVDTTSRSNHTGTQLASTISDFTTAVQGVTIDAAKIGSGLVSNIEFGYLDGVTSAIQTQLNGKEPTITGAATTITSSNLTASRGLISDVNGKVAVSTTTSTELGYVSGVTSAIQTQLNGKEPTITVGTATQYWRGDKTFQTLNTTAVAEGTNLYYTDNRVSTYINTQKNVANGIGGLDANAKLLIAQIPTAAAAQITTSTANAEGTASSVARSDHTHKVNVTNYYVGAATTVTTASTTDVLLTDMTSTPVAGTYFVSFTGSMVNSANGAQRLFFSIYVGGTQVVESERTVGIGGGAYASCTTQSTVTVNGSQAVEIRWRAAAGTNTALDRNFVLLKLS